MRLANIGIGTKILLVVGIVFILFVLGLAAMIGATSFDNLTQVKTAELERTSQILASQIELMERNATLAARRFEESEPIVSELQLLTSLGPYYADPASYFEADFMANGGEIDNADKVYLFQAQLKLIQLLLSTQQINNFSSVRFYLLSPFDVVPDAAPLLALDLGQETITVSQFEQKGLQNTPHFFSITADNFVPPAPNYFGISSAYSFPADDFYRENNFLPVAQHELTIDLGRNSVEQNWRTVNEPYSEILVEGQVPILQTWYPVRVPMANPETWEEALVPIGIVQITQQLDDKAMALLAEQFGLDIGLARDNELLITSLGRKSSGGESSDDAPSITLLESDGAPLTLDENAFNFAWKPVSFANGRANLQAVVLSSVSELAGLTDSLRRQIIQMAILTVLLAGILIYLSLLYLLNRPLGALMDGVQRISRGDLNHSVTTGSADEIGQLAMAFNGMASQVRELVGSLEQRVTDRTQELTAANQAAEVARQRAEMANQAKSEFLSHMSHELRTPLNGILGYTQILRKQHNHTLKEQANGGTVNGEANGRDVIVWNNQDLEQQSHGLNIIQQSGQHLLTLINDVLDMAKIEAQKMELLPSDIELADFLESLVNIFRFRAEQKGLRFVYDAPANLPYSIYADEKRLRQIIINLLSNAIRYTEQGEVTLRVTLTELPEAINGSSTALPSQRTESPSRMLLLHCEIEDTGVGMTAQEISDIFRPFEQSGDLVQRDKGTGLGLTISQNLAQIMGSQIAVQSVPNQGSKFGFELTVRGNVNHLPLLLQPEQIVCGYLGPRRTILTVDDNQNNRSLIRDLLEPLGFRVIDASDGLEAVSLTNEFYPDLVLMDLRMSGINGLETTRVMRAQLSAAQVDSAQRKATIESVKELIIIAASASAFESDREESLQAGCDGFLAKPVQMSELLDLLQTHLDLEWVYEDGGEMEPFASPSVASIKEEATAFVAPPPADLAELLNLAQRGMMRGIREKAAQLAEADPRYGPFADELSALALNFREKDLLALIQRYNVVTR